MASNKGWIGVDLDRTLAVYDKWKGHAHIGEPIEPMVNRVKSWLLEGQEVKIFTARVSRMFEASAEAQIEYVEVVDAIQEWCVKQFGTILPITCIKDFNMLELWDDRAVQVIPNTGETIAESLGVVDE